MADKALTALEVTELSPARLNVQSLTADENDGIPQIKLQGFLGELAPGSFLACRTFLLSPQTAVQIGEFLVEEGKRVATGIHVPGLGEIPGNLRAQG